MEKEKKVKLKFPWNGGYDTLLTAVKKAAKRADSLKVESVEDDLDDLDEGEPEIDEARSSGMSATARDSEKELLRRIKVFNRQHPFYKELSMWGDTKDSLGHGSSPWRGRIALGSGRGQIPGRKAGIMSGSGLVVIFTDGGNKFVELTDKGKDRLADYEDDWLREI